MPWILLGAVVAVAVAFGLFVWRKWIAPWRQIEQIVRQVGGGERPATFLVDGGRQPQRVGLALENISERQLEQNRQAAERASGAETIFAAMQDGLLVVDARRQIVLVNRALRNLFAPREIVPGAPLLDALRDATVDQTIAEALRTGEATRTEVTFSDAQARPDRYVQVSAVPMKSGQGDISGAVVLFHDITGLRRADQIRSDFVANVSHELRTPLAILRGYIETLLDNPETSLDERTRILEVMERHSKRLGLLVEDLLALARLESPNPNLQWSDVNLSTLFEEVVRDWEKKFAEKQLKLVVDLPRECSTVCADETRLQEILHNLFDNAVKYSPQNGEVRLRVEQRRDEIALTVSDSGAGISKSDLPRVFERFYRADKARGRELGGTGLGLSIVKHIAQLHGGRVEAESEVGRGTTIRVVLPATRTKI
jgi:two-component system, OmpR family, phosphate regulon sensor histidine kinase PhoR